MQPRQSASLRIGGAAAHAMQIEGGVLPGNRAEPLPFFFFKDYTKGSDRCPSGRESSGQYRSARASSDLSPSGHEHACFTLSTPTQVGGEWAIEASDREHALLTLRAPVLPRVLKV